MGYFLWFLPYQSKTNSDSVKLYQNPILRIQFAYPGNWQPKLDGLIQGYPTQYNGPNGFFVINAIAGQKDLPETIRDICKKDADIFGSNPTITECINNSRLGYYIYPGPDCPINELHPACFVTQLRNPIYYNGQPCSILMVFSDEQHLNEIISTLEPYYPS